MYGVSDIIFLSANWNIRYHDHGSWKHIRSDNARLLAATASLVLHTAAALTAECQNWNRGKVIIWSVSIDLVLILIMGNNMATWWTNTTHLWKQRSREEEMKPKKLSNMEYPEIFKDCQLNSLLCLKVSLCIYWHFSIFCETVNCEYFMFFSHSPPVSNPSLKLS